MTTSGIRAPQSFFAEHRDDLRRLFVCLAGALVVALMTGPPGSGSEPSRGFRMSLLHARVFGYLLAGLVVWVLYTIYLHFADQVRGAAAVATDRTRTLFTPRPARYSFYVVLLVIAILYPQTLSGFWQGVLVDQIGIFVLLALGLNVVVGFAGLLDLGYAAFFAIGAYTTAYFTGSLPVKPPFDLNPFWTIPLAVAAAMLAGVLLGAPTLRLRGDYLAIVTLGFGEIIQITANNSDHYTNGAQGIFTEPHFSLNLLGIHYHWKNASLPYYYLLLLFVVLSMVGSRLLEDSRVGRAWTAIREDEVAAEATGINTLKYKIMAFSIGASTSGFAGVLFASKNNSFSPADFALTISILVVVLVIFGGMGSVWGVVLGAVILQWFPALLRKHDIINPANLFIYYGALLVIMMIFRPQGLLPSRRRAREIGLAEHGVGGADALGAPAGSPTG